MLPGGKTRKIRKDSKTKFNAMFDNEKLQEHNKMFLTIPVRSSLVPTPSTDGG